jgi:hypothetical protein
MVLKAHRKIFITHKRYYPSRVFFGNIFNTESIHQKQVLAIEYANKFCKLEAVLKFKIHKFCLR